MKWIEGGVTAARGFLAAGLSAGVKRSRKPDLALIVAEHRATAAGVFTRNRVQAAPVLISQERVRGGAATAVLINSGCANCMTGETGYRDALALGARVAKVLKIDERHVLLASTGLIGRRLPVPRIHRVIPELARRLSRARHRAAAEAILTTDRVPKEAAAEGTIGGMRCRVGGMAKGAGMIQPSMATMLGVITTDVRMAPGLLRRMLQEATAATFNRITVDGDMSTNDTVFALASGASGVTIRPGTRAARQFDELLTAVCGRLAWSIVKDGEGASKTVLVGVKGARNQREADAAARQVANSLLVKTMLTGSDPNVGRIAAAVGASAARFDPNRLDISIGGQLVVQGGVARRVGTAALRSLLQDSGLSIVINLHAGRAWNWLWTCDLSEAYVRINAGYAT